MTDTVNVMSSPKLSDQLNRWLDRVDQYIWPNQHQADNTSQCFYTFKPFPPGLTPIQTKSWAELQRNALSPFEAGDSYYYLSTQGLHLWICQKKFSGLPETSVQTRLADGRHIVSGKKFHYQQIWASGIMTSCITSTTNENDSGIALDYSQPWAKKRSLDAQIKSPIAWMIIVAFVFLCIFTWFSAGVLTLYTQYEIAQNKTDTVSAEINDKLAKQTQLREKQDNLALLRSWREEQGSLPESLSTIAEQINPLGRWEVKEIAWQDRQLVLELDAGDIDIAALVNDLESAPRISTIGIRPHGSSGAYLLEATFNE